MAVSKAKANGAYYTPTDVAQTLVKWAVRSDEDRLLDPSCGDGEFLLPHRNSTGVEPDIAAVARAARRTNARIHVADFFAWTSKTNERFDCVVGNPPFIRYQRFRGEVRQRALAICNQAGVRFSGLTASWAPFLVASTTVLKRGGRMSFVVPAEIGHAPYATPLVEHLAQRFDDLRLVAVRRSIFPHLSQDVWLLFADGYGGRTQRIGLTAWDKFRAVGTPPNPDRQVNLSDWRQCSHRIRPFLLPVDTLQLYQHLSSQADTYRMGEVARVGIGYVTGANEFFHLRPSDVESQGIPMSFLAPSVVNGKSLPKKVVNHSAVSKWLQRDDRCLLLRIQRNDELAKSVQRYLASEAAYQAKEAYKCRNRSPWYVVPDVVVPDAFLTYMNNGGPTLVLNAAECVCTNSLHAVRMREGHSVAQMQASWRHSLVSLSAEIEGHPLGGGMLKLEPREASRLLLPSADLRISRRDEQRIQDGIETLRKWRHHE